MPAKRGAVLCAILAVGLLAGCEKKGPPPAVPKPPPVETAKPKDPLTVAREEIAGGKAVMVDVRSQGERDDGYLDGSIFLPITDIRKKSEEKDFKEWAAAKLPQGKVLYLH